MRLEAFTEVQLGTGHKTPEEFGSIGKSDRAITSHAEGIIRSAIFARTVNPKPYWVRLAKVTPKELGFTQRVRFDTLCEHIGVGDLGIKLCHPEVGPQWWRQCEFTHVENRKDWRSVIAMKAIHSLVDELSIFSHLRDVHLELDGECGDPRFLWSLTTEFIVELQA